MKRCRACGMHTCRDHRALYCWDCLNKREVDRKRNERHIRALVRAGVMVAIAPESPVTTVTPSRPDLYDVAHVAHYHPGGTASEVWSRIRREVAR